MKLKREKAGQLFLRSTACLLLSVFILTEVAYGAPLNISAGQSESQPTQTVDLIYSLQIPSKIGSVKSRFLPRSQHRNSNLDQKKPVIIHIQDAHSHPEAQRNIRSILKHLADQRGIEKIVVEGAFGKVDADLFNFFPIEEVNQKMANHLLDLGELTGVELYAIEERERHVPIQGIEDKQLYLRSYQLFKDLKSKKPEIEEVLKVYAKHLEQLEITQLPKDLHELIIKQKLWNRGADGAVDYFTTLRSLALKYLNSDFSDPRYQFDWPNLTRMMKLKDMESALKQDDAKNELRELREILEKARGKNPLQKDMKKRAFLIKGLEAMIENNLAVWLETQMERVEVRSIRFFTEILYAELESIGLSLLKYDNLLGVVGYKILEEELVSVELFKETERLQKIIENQMIKSNKEREIVSLVKDLHLMSKLLTLTITRDQFEDYAFRKGGMVPRFMQKRLQHLSKEEGIPFISEEWVAMAEEFYELSKMRDETLYENALKIANAHEENEPAVMVLVAGGFHSDGLIELLKENEVAHLVVSPKMTYFTDDHLYEDVMAGKNANIDHLILEASTLVKSYLIQSIEDKVNEEQPNLVLNAIFGVAIEALEQVGLSEVEIRDLIVEVVTSHQFFNDDLQVQVVLQDDGEAQLIPLKSRLKVQVSRREPEPQSLTLADQTRFQAAGAVRQEVRDDLPPGTPDVVKNLIESEGSAQYQRRIIRAINEVYLMREEHLQKAAQLAGTTKIEHTEVLLKTAVHSPLPPSREIPFIEFFIETVYTNRSLRQLSLAHRFAFILGVIDQDTFPSTHEAILEVAKALAKKGPDGNLEDEDVLDFPHHTGTEQARDRITAEEYTKVASTYSKAERGKSYRSNMLLRYALSHVVFDMERGEREALEKENMIEQFIAETINPGSGDIPKIVFITDIHGAPNVGELIAHALGIKNYHGVETVEDLKERWAAEKDHPIEDENILFIGGSDYVDRGPKPYLGFKFNVLLRETGKLKYIIGNHDIWKDWNLLGVHFRVHDTLKEIRKSGKHDEKDIEDHVAKISPFISDVHLVQPDPFSPWDSTDAYEEAVRNYQQKVKELEDEKRQFVRDLLQAIKEGKDTDKFIDDLANKIIDAGGNPNHSLYWWSREWYEHANWADTFLNQLNQELINGNFRKINEVYRTNADLRALLRAILNNPQDFDEAAQGLIDSLPQAVKNNIETSDEILFDEIEASEFAKGEDVQEAKKRITELKETNAEIRSINEALSATGGVADEELLGRMNTVTAPEDADYQRRLAAINEAGAGRKFEGKIPQHRVPNTFPQTSEAARRLHLDSLNVVRRLNDLMSMTGDTGFRLPVEDVELVTPENYRTNPIVAETALWDMKNFRLVYVDRYGNAYLHGIVPIKEEMGGDGAKKAVISHIDVNGKKKKRQFDVSYRVYDRERQEYTGEVLQGLSALERAQFDVRTFFEGLDEIPDSPEFRAKMMVELGEAFRILEEFYSDTLAYLKPDKIKQFLKKGVAAFDLSVASTLNSHTQSGATFVGHVDLGKLLAKGISYWEGAELIHSLVHGDFGWSPEYFSLGAIITIFNRDENNDLTGIVREGYEATAASVRKEMKDAKKRIDKINKILEAPGEKDDVNQLQGELQSLQTRLNDELPQKLERVLAEGDNIKPIPIHGDLDPEQDENVVKYGSGPWMIQYYVKNFVDQNIRAYEELSQTAGDRGETEKAIYFQNKAKFARQQWQRFVKAGGLEKAEAAKAQFAEQAQALRQRYEERKEVRDFDLPIADPIKLTLNVSGVELSRIPNERGTLRNALGVDRIPETSLAVARNVTGRIADPSVVDNEVVARNLFLQFELPFGEDLTEAEVAEAANRAGLIIVTADQVSDDKDFYLGLDGILSKPVYQNMHIAVVVETDDEETVTAAATRKEEFDRDFPEQAARFRILTTTNINSETDRIMRDVMNKAKAAGADTGEDFSDNVIIFSSNEKMNSEISNDKVWHVHRDGEYGVGAEIFNLDQQTLLALKLLPGERIQQLRDDVDDIQKGYIAGTQFFRGQHPDAINKAFIAAVAAFRFRTSA